MSIKCQRYTLVCESCGRQYEVVESQKNQRFCSRKCYFSKPENNSFYGKKHSIEAKNKISRSNKGRKRSAEIKSKLSLGKRGKNNSFYGKKHTEKTKELISLGGIKRNLQGAGNPFYGKHHTLETRQRMSQIRVMKIASGEINPINMSRRGYFNNIRYDSGYELKRIQQLMSDSLVKLFKRNNNIFIAYEFEGKKRKYIPDFFIEYNDGRKVVEEIKGYEKPVDRMKYQAAEKYLQILGIQYRILYKKDIFISDREYRKFLKEMKNE